MADFNTDLAVTGTQEEYATILKEIAKYRKDSSSIYFDSAFAYAKGKKMIDVIRSSDSVIDTFVSTFEGELQISASGPYGRFYSICDDISLFEDIAKAVPHCAFSGTMDGFDPGGNQTVHAELSDGVLHLFYKYPDADYFFVEIPMIVEDVIESLPYSKFIELFKIDADSFDEDHYEDFIWDTAVNGGTFPNEDGYEEFVDKYGSALSEDEYKKAVQEVILLGIGFDGGENREWDEEKTIKVI